MSGDKHKTGDMLRAKAAKRSKQPNGSADTHNGKQRSSRPFFVRARRISAVIVIVAVLAGAGYTVFGRTAPGAVIDGVSVGPFDMSGLDREQAISRMTAGYDGFRLVFTEPSKGDLELTVNDSELPVIAVDIEGSVDAALGVGKRGSAVDKVRERVDALLSGTRLETAHSVDKDRLVAMFKEQYPTVIEPAVDASFRIVVSQDGAHDIDIVEAHDGTNFDMSLIAARIGERIGTGESSPIALVTVHDDPSFDADDIAPLLPVVELALDRAPIALAADGETWTLSRSTVADWLKVGDLDGRPVVMLDSGKVLTYFEARGASFADTPSDAVFVEKDGKVVEFVPHVDGQELDIAEAKRLISDYLFAPRNATDDEDGVARIELPIATVHPEMTTEKSNPYGITERIGTGASNFRGSPTNRRINIRVGAEAVNGTLVPPGEEFSLMGTLGEIDAASGYLPELVIKEGRTIPEYGGGLCQIGTTTFRAVLGTGLPVTARRNHSYRVPYYERDGDGNYMGPGMDATIYDPAPDFRFVNDTPAHILILTKIIGDRLQFDIWGKDDGRTAKTSEVSIFNVREPPPTKIIKTTDIPPGEVKCTEKPHVGSSTVFTYTVTKADGTVNEEDFYSYYKPWQEVCLHGVTEEELLAEQNGGVPSADGQPTDPSVPPAEPEISTADTAGVSGI